MPNLIDHYLLFRIKTKQDPEAFARLYDRYVEAIYRFVILKLPSADDAQDVTAEAFTRAWQYISDRKDVTNFRALVYRIARNLVVDRYRSEHRTISLDAVTQDPLDPSTDMTPIAGDAGREKARIEARADLAVLVTKLARLKEDYRDVLTLRLVDDLPFTVIAEILEKTPGNARVIYHRALKALKDLDTTLPNP